MRLIAFLIVVMSFGSAPGASGSLNHGTLIVCCPPGAAFTAATGCAKLLDSATHAKAIIHKKNFCIMVLYRE
jgi:hypothetical protein